MSPRFQSGCARAARAAAGQLLVLVGALLAARPARAVEIHQRLSIKFILDQFGQLPPGAYADSLRLKRVVDSTNVFLARLGRGYRYELLPFATVSGASQFFDLSPGENLLLQDTAMQDTVKYHWASNAINCYVVHSGVAGGYSTIPSSPDDGGHYIFIWLAGQDSLYRDIGFPHELGHYNDLYHPWVGGSPICPDDCVADTRPEPDPFQCTTSFGCATGGSQECCCATKEANLSAAALAGGWTVAETNAIRWNCMGYFGADDCATGGKPFNFGNMVLTDGQLDRWTDATRGYHPREVTGLTWFVDPAGGGFFANGTSVLPFGSVLAGVNAASGAGTDIVMLRGGAYAENLTLSKRVTLRASRGHAIVGF